MIIKKFQGATEQEAIMKAKEEMGSSAVVLNIKTIKHRGLGRFFKNDIVEITAALEEKQAGSNMPGASNQPVNTGVIYDINTHGIMHDAMDAGNKAEAIEAKLDNLQAMFENRMRDTKAEKSDEELREEKQKENDINLAFIKLVYNQLIDNEVDEIYANRLMSEIETTIKKESSMDSILGAIYQKIVLKLGQPHLIESVPNKTKLIFFVGPTGVGKTTTIAKLASYFKLEKKLKVGLITSDTYRIAAVEQLRTYANILDIPLQVIYTIGEFNEAVNDFKNYDLIFVDTAGRSHKNEEQCQDVFSLIRDSKVPGNVIKETFLVLSAATKYKDLIKISDVFGKIENCSIIFTKLDETICYGNILNIRLRTEASLSYVTSGQTVPEDIGSIDGQRIARCLLGGSE